MRIDMKAAMFAAVGLILSIASYPSSAQAMSKKQCDRCKELSGLPTLTPEQNAEWQQCPMLWRLLCIDFKVPIGLGNSDKK
jgi:hypothetical protein